MMGYDKAIHMPSKAICRWTIILFGSGPNTNHIHIPPHGPYGDHSSENMYGV